MQGPRPSVLVETVSTLCSPTGYLCAVHLYRGMSPSNSVHYRVRSSPILDPILIRVNPTHILTPYFLEVHFNTTFHPYLCLPRDVLFRYCNQNCEIISSIHTCYTPIAFLLLLSRLSRSSYSSWVPFQYIWLVYLLWISIDTQDVHIHVSLFCGRAFKFPSTWVKHFTLPCITLYSLPHGQPRRHSVLLFRSFREKSRSVLQIKLRYVLWYTLYRYVEFVSIFSVLAKQLRKAIFCSHGTSRHAVKGRSSVPRFLTKYFDQIKFWSTSAKKITNILHENVYQFVLGWIFGAVKKYKENQNTLYICLQVCENRALTINPAERGGMGTRNSSKIYTIRGATKMPFVYRRVITADTHSVTYSQA